MKFKLDENLPVEAAEMLTNTGYEALTVLDQCLGGHSDAVINKVCQKEERILITLDLDFSNILAYPPDQYPGIIVLRLKYQDKSSVLNLISQLIPQLSLENPYQKLWIVSKDKIRIRGE
ncbi:MAG: DUF5615 family PIN-like protein [SAR324 cluster bacterium]|nr:DUF5615 family PIN-like protein [SAR324 cluster bacterium]